MKRFIIILLIGILSFSCEDDECTFEAYLIPQYDWEHRKPVSTKNCCDYEIIDAPCELEGYVIDGYYYIRVPDHHK